MPRAVSATPSVYFSSPGVITANLGAAGPCPVGTHVTVQGWFFDANGAQTVGRSFNINLWP